MSSLYRRYRPTQFTQVIGQDHIRSSLESALKKEMIAHAYLFSGPRGTGKTTVARLFAKAVNCPKRKKADACDECEACEEIKSGRAVDVIEIDAASNRGIDEIRELRERIAFAPTSLRYKVYIIDEVHMLTKEAFNALLKTLEEPPSHAIFILATTELHKVPDTIISRCQRYQFHRAPLQALQDILLDIAKKEGITLSESGALLLAERADGSFRDGLTLLGSVANHSTELSEEALRDLLGLPTEETVTQVLEMIRNGQSAELSTFLEQRLAEGADIAVLVKQITERLKKSIFSTQAGTISIEEATPLLEQCLVGISRARTSTDPVATLVSLLLRLTLANKSTVVVSRPAPAVPQPAVTDIQKKEPTPPEAPSTPAVDAVVEKPASEPLSSGDFWGAFLQEIKKHNHALYMLVRSAKFLDLTQDKVIVAVKFRFYSERLFETKNRKIVEQAASIVAGRQISLECQVKTDMEEPNKAEGEIMNAVVDVFELEEVAS